MTNRLVRRCAAVLSAIALTGALAGCGGSDEEPSGDPTSASSSGTAGSTEAAVDPTPSAYLTVGSVELTEPGTELAFGEDAVIAWDRGKGQLAALDVTVDRVDRTTFDESFKGWVITKEMKQQTPLFVRLSVANAGDTDLGGEQVPIAVIDDSGIRVQPTTAAEKTFKPCPGGPLPEKFKAGAKAQLCMLYLLAPGAKFAAVGFLPIDDQGQPVAEPITWTGKLTAIGEKVGGEGKKGDKKKGQRQSR